MSDTVFTSQNSTLILGIDTPTSVFSGTFNLYDLQNFH